MKTSLQIFVLLLASVGSLAAQTNTFPSSGNVGIGTTSPGEALQIKGNLRFESANTSIWRVVPEPTTNDRILQFENGSSTGTGGFAFKATDAGFNAVRLKINNNGNVGIGKTPGLLLDVAGPIRSTSGSIDVRLQAGAAGAAGIGSFSNDPVLLFVNGVERMRLTTGGNVGIGTQSPSHKLAVNGTIRAKEVIVDTGWADYVFADDYRLAPLSEVEAHIKEYKRLPGMPSEETVLKEGVSLGEMQTLMLAKLEEVTLHLIELKKENDELRREIAARNNH